MATQTELMDSPMEFPSESKALTPAQRDTLFKPGEINNPKGAGTARHLQMAAFRNMLMEIDPEYDAPRLAVMFMKVYEIATGRGVIMVPTTEGEENRTGIKYRARGVTGKDMVAASEFLMDRSFGKSIDADQGNASGGVTIQIIGIPAGSQVAVGVKTPEDQTSPALLTPEFPPDEL